MLSYGPTSTVTLSPPAATMRPCSSGRFGNWMVHPFVVDVAVVMLVVTTLSLGPIIALPSHFPATPAGICCAPAAAEASTSTNTRREAERIITRTSRGRGTSQRGETNTQSCAFRHERASALPTESLPRRGTELHLLHPPSPETAEAYDDAESTRCEPRACESRAARRLDCPRCDARRSAGAGTRLEEPGPSDRGARERSGRPDDARREGLADERRRAGDRAA